MGKFEHLFKPIKIGNMEVPNRICRLATDTSSSHTDGEVSENDLYTYKELAKGGSGLIIVGATSPEAETGKSTVTCMVADGDEYIPGLAKLADTMHDYGAKCAVQLEHPGRQAALPRNPEISASDMVVDIPWSQSYKISYEEEGSTGKGVEETPIEKVMEIVDLFSEAAWRVKQAGFDAVELHGAHGYLISQFMSPYLNSRTDRYGGSFENRMRFPLEIIHSIQKKCGEDFPIIVRYSVDEWVPGGRELPESIKVAKRFEEAGVAAVDLSQCVQESPGAGFDPMYYQEGWTMHHAEKIKEEVDIPVIISHSLRNPDYCEEVLREGKTDMVGLARQLLADPYWPIKAKFGKVEEIRKCISCLTGCWQESLTAKKEVQCAINPACYDKSFANLEVDDNTVDIAIVGGGPAGMEAARFATTRGHNATIFEKSGELGGAILGCCLVPGKDKMKWYADWIRRQVRKLDIDIKLNHAPSIEELKEFDIVLNATGAKSYVPEVPGNIDQDMLVNFEKVLTCVKKNCEYYPGGREMAKVGEKVMVWGDHYAAADTAAFLASIGKDVTIVTENSTFASEVEMIHMYVLRKRFDQEDAEALNSKPFKYPVDVKEDSTVLEIKDGEVLIEDKNFTRERLKIDDVVTCHTKPNTDFLEEMSAAGLNVVNVGDSVEPRNLHAAVREGALFGKNIEGDTFMNPNYSIVNDLPLDVEEQLRD
ncbi:MAG: FAD-dependent oxidoreductase [Spirochaetales bacterium]|nr:FAD-dependent oxidoreductase [Spirochaetales bacterium]